MMSGIHKIPTIIPSVAQLMFQMPASFSTIRIIIIGMRGIVMFNLFLELLFIFAVLYLSSTKAGVLSNNNKIIPHYK
jgi:hypothetical protein